MGDNSRCSRLDKIHPGGWNDSSSWAGDRGCLRVVSLRCVGGGGCRDLAPPESEEKRTMKKKQKTFSVLMLMVGTNDVR